MCLSLIGQLRTQKRCRPTVQLPAEAFFTIILTIQHQCSLHCRQWHSKQNLGNSEPGSIKDSSDPSRPAGQCPAVSCTVIHLPCHVESSGPSLRLLVPRKAVQPLARCGLVICPCQLPAPAVDALSPPYAPGYHDITSDVKRVRVICVKIMPLCEEVYN